MISILLSLIISCVSAEFNGLPQTPVVCHYSHPPSVYQLNHTVDCKNLLNRRLERYHQNATLFKLNLNRYNTQVWSCQKLQRIDVVYKSFGPVHKLSQKTLSRIITINDCRRMIETKMCPDGDKLNIIYQQSDDIWTTNLSSIIKAKTFQIKLYNVTNCFLTTGNLWINRLTGNIESNLGSVTHCTYASGFCKLSDNRIFVWNPHSEAKCSFLPWKTVAGYSEDNFWYSTENEPMVLTLGNNSSISNDQCGHNFYTSDQGIGIMIDVRKKRYADDISGFNPVTQSELNMKLQGIVSQLLTSPEVNGLSAACALAQEIAYSWHVNMYKNPTMVIRRILRNPYITAEVRGQAVFIWTCTPVESYTVLPMKHMCTNLLPITFSLDKDESSRQLLGYLEPSTNEILASATETNCDQVDAVVLELNDTFFWYSHKNGIMHFNQSLPSFPTYIIPTIAVSRNNTNSLLSSIVYKTGSMYNRSEYMHFVDMNDLHRYMEHEKLKGTLFKPFVKMKEFTSSISLPDFKTDIGELFSNVSNWWSSFYWFAVIAGFAFILYLGFKITCSCKKLIQCRRNRNFDTFV